MNLLIENEHLDKILSEQSWVMLYFSGENCNVCNSFKPKLRELIEQNFPEINLYDVPVEQSPELVGRFRMFSIPGLILFVEGKEYIREVRNISLHELDEKIKKFMKIYNS